MIKHMTPGLELQRAVCPADSEAGSDTEKRSMRDSGDSAEAWRHGGMEAWELSYPHDCVCGVVS